MARVKSIIHFEGSLEDLVFYRLNGIHCVRRKDGMQGERIKNNPNFERTRENNSEFGHCSAYGKSLRNVILPLVSKAKDDRLVSRMQRLLGSIKDLDSVSPRGQRKVWRGLETTEGRRLLKGFDFNGNATLGSVLKANWTVDPESGSILISGFDPGRELVFPEGATHVRFQGALLHLDSEPGSSVIAYSEPAIIPASASVMDLELVPNVIPEGDGRKLFLLSLSFFQEMNGERYPFKNEKRNVLHILEVL
ncbi:hypothetical protein NAT51_16125 [Flavobacterium amniphilum]|uniref:hypothetical protein n=1 Tax=Flavobacterium amniphilum TaxID=1834035 RepID=UPI00202A1BD7|nr:hypothetical protein [Flavobacterium amniphilum]MCL9807063.1 hypothetical protein [Flavobacterium amniphilum]